ncbi:MAG: aminoacyl-tRNA hydrolase [Oscillospiraceae bacterium]|jgi:PTH1 family peptidyl-tRNA hydrolase|nr:aminoacyl-tRNA hydrolase [Oscillospiraceae bacterium]
MPFFHRQSTAPQWVVLFLGNPGPRYATTRHNAGFMCADALAKSRKIKLDRSKFKSLTCVTELGGQSALLVKPQTFMNLSGDAARDALKFYKLPLERLLVVSDETALPLGKIRVRRSGSAGGHNGLRDIIDKCGGESFPRVRIGVGDKPNPNMDLADWVLSAFRGNDLDEILRVAERAADCVEAVLRDGVDAAMGQYN